MKNENDILRELLHCYQSIVSIDQRTEKMRTLEWVLGEDIQERLLTEYLGRFAGQNVCTSTLDKCSTPSSTPTNDPDNTDECDTDEDTEEITEDNDDEEQPLEFPDCLTEWERPFYGLMHEHPELKPTEIADIMNVSYVTARKHYKNIRKKMGWGD